jgi:hypothetical protein
VLGKASDVCEVELGRDENSIVFEGIVAVALGFKAGLEPGKYTWG